MVDDDILQLKLFERLLTSNGYHCRIAISVDSAEALLRMQVPDLIISDYHMPGKNGFEFRRRLLANDVWKQIPFLFLTSVNDDEFIQQGLDLEAIDFINKDTPPRQVLSKIDNLMQSVRLHYEKSLSEIKGIAEKLNLRNIPQHQPVLNNFSVDFFNKSYQDNPGGDFIDFIKVNERYTFIVLGDVMGKKWGAWFFSFSFLSYIRSAIRLCVYDGSFSLSEILGKLNRVIHADDLIGDIFSTLSILLIDDELGKITYAGAGDLPLLKYKKGESQLVTYQSDGILLGFADKVEFSEIEVTLDKDEELFLITDGMIDFEINGAKRSDINTFKLKLFQLKEEGGSTDDIKHIIFDEHQSQVDDSSLITVKRVEK